uniref:Ubiquitin-like domain-containing protein n=1 Tax=Eutreptiella gymnastica TaxID=73025 RepID=A0A7S1IWP0_9EUGL
MHVRVQDPSGRSLDVNVSNNNDGSYTATFNGSQAGAYALAVRFGAEPIPGPTAFTLWPGPTDPANCLFLGLNSNYEEIKRLEAKATALWNEHRQTRSEVGNAPLPVPVWMRPDPAPGDVEHAELDLDLKYADGLVGGVVGRRFRFRILARDALHNPCDATAQFRVTLNPTGTAVGTPEPVLAEVAYEGNGYYGVCYTVRGAGAYRLDVALRQGAGLVSMQTKELAFSAAAVDAQSCVVVHHTHPGDQPECRSGEKIKVLLSLRDRYSNPVGKMDGQLAGSFYTPWDKCHNEGVPFEQPMHQGAPGCVDPTNAWEPDEHEPDLVVAPAPSHGDGVYQVTIKAYTVGPHVAHVTCASEIVYTFSFTVVPAEPMLPNCKVVATSEDVRLCIECDRRTAIFFSRQCGQAFCDSCWKVRHSNCHRASHPRSMIGVDDRGRELGEELACGILMRDAYDNNILHLGSDEPVEARIEFHEYLPEPKARKDVKAKKKGEPVAIEIRSLDGLLTAVEVLLSDTVSQLKRRVFEMDGLPTNVQKLVLDGTQDMEDSKSLKDYQVMKGSIVDVELADVGEDQQQRVPCVDTGRGVWDVRFPVQGYGQYCLLLQFGSHPLTRLHRFTIEAPAGPPKGKASQTKMLDLTLELEDLKGRWAALSPAEDA